MGMGDEIMATARARALHERRGIRVRILGARRERRWHAIWEHNPRLVRPEERGNFQFLVDGPGVRSYIAEKKPDRWVWRDVHPEPGEIYLAPHEAELAVPGIVVIEPNLKPSASINKRWSRWQKVVDKAPDLPWVQMGTGPILRGVRHIPTPTFRDACGVMSKAALYVGHEGGLHHAAAALGVRAVVVFGGYISPAQTGYAMHRNLFTAMNPCGSRTPCGHCRLAMDLITPDVVIEAIHAELSRPVAP